MVETQRLTRTQFERWFFNREVSLDIMEACGSAHHCGRWLNGLGIEVRLLPAQYVRAYVKRNKTYAADCAIQKQPQQGDVCAGKQAGADLICHATRQGAVWLANRALKQEDQQG